ncbi:MORN repeat-containing protein [Alkalihalobacterium alkalinitrilicum]|uniref:MORN repeat-containing protein n=1 Tax=Alkalihalobacterium alkalinitrilicum TaxID=427920 RepID=UPI000994C299|nr:hypothetical protein [Alkalihalobacterium alkalinitrilicum]
MISILFVLTILTLILLIVGQIKPKLIFRQSVGTSKYPRLRVLLLVGSTFILLLLATITFGIHWSIFILAVSLCTSLIFFLFLLLGLVSPSLVLRKALKKTRWAVIKIHGLSFVVSIILFVFAGLVMDRVEESNSPISMASYVGERVNGEKHGQGVLANSFESYTGEWKNDLRDGTGTESFKLGSLLQGFYDGEWKDDQKEGYGVESTQVLWMTSKYEGDWKNGKRHGAGEFTDRNGNIYSGQWKEGQPSGEGEFILTNGERYVCEVEGFKRHGYGTLTNKDGSIEEGQWENDRLVEE